MTTEKLRELLAKAHPGAWHSEPSTPSGERAFLWAAPGCVVICDFELGHDAAAELIVALRNHAEALLDVVEAARRIVDAASVWTCFRHAKGEHSPVCQMRTALAALDEASA